MTTTVSFVMPVRHPDNMRDKALHKRYLAETIQSLVQQSCPDWTLTICGNPGTELPDLPPQASFQPVDLPPNAGHEQGGRSFQEFMDFVRQDKGARIAAARDAMRAADYTMLIDDDDFLHRELVETVRSRQPENGYYIEDGYIWKTGSAYLFPTKNFFMKCGTSHIVRSSLFDLLENEMADEAQFRSEMFGAHTFIKSALAKRGHPLEAFPLPAAVYRKANANAHTVSRKNLKSALMQVELVDSLRSSFKGGRFSITAPGRILSHLGKIRRVSASDDTFGIARTMAD